MKTSKLSLAALLCSSACILPTADDEQNTTAASADASEGGSAPGSSDESGNGTTAATTLADDSGSSSGAATSATTGDVPPTSCDDASLLLGNPYFTGDLQGWNPQGQGMLDDPPLRSRHLAVVGDRLAVDTQFEVWLSDGDQIRRIAGDELEVDTAYQPAGACADVRILIGAGIAALPGDRLVVADRRGNGLIELRDVSGDCTAAAIAGNPDATFDVDIFDGLAAEGDIDGPGIDARFAGVERPVADDAGNLYVFDMGNADIKRVADDADRTVSTVFHFEGDALPMAMTVLGDTLYVSGANVTDDFLWAIDPATGEREVVFSGRGLFEEIDPAAQAIMFGLTNDGVDLLVATGKGYLFRLSTAAEPLATIAGMGPIVDYPTDLDLANPIPLAQLPLHSYGVNEADLVRMGNDLLFTNDANGVGFHVWSIHCE
jgi:hypothetical protein